MEIGNYGRRKSDGLNAFNLLDACLRMFSVVLQFVPRIFNVVIFGSIHDDSRKINFKFITTTCKKGVHN